jgi:uncharacterized repeat protein (TIGR03803 family)
LHEKREKWRTTSFLVSVVKGWPAFMTFHDDVAHPARIRSPLRGCWLERYYENCFTLTRTRFEMTMGARSGEDSGQPGESAMIKRVLSFLAFAGLGGFLLLAAARADAQTETILYSFGGVPGEGAIPHGALLYKKGNLYGTTTANAPSGNLGNVFEITADGQYKVLHNFGSQPGDGTAPCDYGGLAFRGGKLYGTALYGGAIGSLGVVFELTLKGKETILYTFRGLPGDGAYPFASVIFDKAGNLYGTTEEGGNGNCVGGCGIVYEVTKGGEEEVLYSFQDAADALFPDANLTFDKAGNLYGTSNVGGVYEGGTVFELSPAGVEKVLYSFNRQGGDGNYPSSAVVFGKKGVIYGTTFYGGVYGQGTVFELSATGEEKLLYSFGGQSSDGINAYGNLVLDKKGNIYGTTFAGGLYGQGTVFELSPTGEEKILYTFGSQAGDGNTPLGDLVFDTAGNLYGVTEYGGVYGFGTVFKIAP